MSVLLYSLLGCSVAIQGAPASSRHHVARQENTTSDITSIIDASPLLSLHRDLVEIESITADEGEIGEWLAEWLDEHDFNNPDVHPRVILTSHLDVVAPHFEYNAVYSNTSDAREDIEIHRRGTVDAKAPVAAMIYAALELLEEGQIEEPGDIALLFVVHEEAGGQGMYWFSDSDLYAEFYDTVEGFIFGEPTENRLATGHKGSASLTLSVNGMTAHSAYPENGVSAISLLLPALLAVDQLDALSPEDGGLPTSEKFGRSTLNVGVLEAGTAANVVPGYAQASAAIRVAGGEPEEFEKAINARVALLGTDPAVEVAFRFNHPAVDLEGDVEGFETGVMNYGTDIMRLDYREDVKMYLYEPGTIEVAHGVDEHVTLGDLEKALEDYKMLVGDVLGF